MPVPPMSPQLPPPIGSIPNAGPVPQLELPDYQRVEGRPGPTVWNEISGVPGSVEKPQMASPSAPEGMSVGQGQAQKAEAEYTNQKLTQEIAQALWDVINDELGESAVEKEAEKKGK